MNTLCTRLLKPEPDLDTVTIQWTTRLGSGEKSGLVHVVVPKALGNDKERGLIAELTVIRYQLLDRELLGKVKGKPDIGLEVGTGQTKKLIMGQSATLSHLNKYARFAHVCIPAQISVGKKSQAEPNEPEETIELYQDNRVFEETTAGTLELSKHALERLVQRHEESGFGVPNNVYKTMLNMLNNPNLREQTLDAKLNAYKRKKYGPGNKAEIWNSPDTQFFFTVIRDDDDSSRGIVVTVFTRFTKFDETVPNTMAQKEAMEGWR